MGKLGYWQECTILEVSTKDLTTSDHGKEVGCKYLRIDISARNLNTGAALNKRYLVVRVLNKKLMEFFEFLEYPVRAKLRLYASGYRRIEDSNRCACAIDVYECEVLDDDNNR